jgi:hypothetical protein
VSEIQRLTAHAQDLNISIGHCNDFYMTMVALTVILAVGVFIAQLKISQKSKELQKTQEDLIREKDRVAKADSDIKNGKIAEALKQAGESNKAAGEANERAGKAQASLALAEQQAAEANTKAEGFRLDIAKANESAKDAEARAVEAKLELARFRAPRTLSQQQENKIAARLRPFGPNTVDVIIIGDAPEITNLTQHITQALQKAGWNVKIVGKAISGPNVSGVLVGTHTGTGGATTMASEALISALQSEGILTEKFQQFGDELPMAIVGNWDANHIASIRILVSAKP